MTRTIVFFYSFLLVLLPYSEAQSPSVELNPKGWQIPDIKELALEHTQTIKLQGIREEVIAEKWRLPKGSAYRIGVSMPWQSEPVCEKIWWLVVYKMPSEGILCYEYARLLTDKNSGRELGVVLSIIIDLDNDGIYESQFDGEGEEEIKLQIASLVRVKLGISKEAALVIKIIRAALRGHLIKQV
jgi:hypothetical protein